MKARIDLALGPYWGGIAQAVDVLAAIAALGAIGSLPAVLNVLARNTRLAAGWLRHLQPSSLRLPLAVLFSLSLLALHGCAQTAIRAPASSQADPQNAIRTLGSDQRFFTLPSQSLARRVRAMRAGQPVNVLALSGGGADGAFGAGALVGLTRSASRPQFSVVTGVSTGALIAPYAFLGSDWDHQLVEVYTSGRAEHLLRSRGLGALFGSSLYSGAPLKELVDRYATDDLIQAVAREASSGRLLLVATTDVSTGEPVIWDLGSIAMHGGSGARALFRDVLVASASVPGIFPPVVIRVQEQQALYEEVHVDGTIALPFLVPPAFIAPAQDASDPSHGAVVYVIVDGRLSERAAPVSLRARSILSRSVSAGIDHMLRTALELAATDAAHEGAQFHLAAIPLDYPQLESLDFRTASMRALFLYGFQCAQRGRLWTSSPSARGDNGSNPASGAGPRLHCPADDEFIGRLAVR